ncbi:hypothetical protein TNCV_3154891 [Trichonephila clavipes]|nr:hypothetical protein TNCV_3154891 [Trichonephila clavipes]
MGLPTPTGLKHGKSVKVSSPQVDVMGKFGEQRLSRDQAHAESEALGPVGPCLETSLPLTLLFVMFPFLFASMGFSHAILGRDPVSTTSARPLRPPGA